MYKTLCPLFCFLLFDMFFRSTMSRNYFVENWTSSVTQTWWTLLWMCTEACLLRRKFPIVSGAAAQWLVPVSPELKHTLLYTLIQN